LYFANSNRWVNSHNNRRPKIIHYSFAFMKPWHWWAFILFGLYWEWYEDRILLDPDFTATYVPSQSYFLCLVLVASIAVAMTWHIQRSKRDRERWLSRSPLLASAPVFVVSFVVWQLVAGFLSWQFTPLQSPPLLGLVTCGLFWLLLLILGTYGLVGYFASEFDNATKFTLRSRAFVSYGISVSCWFCLLAMLLYHPMWTVPVKSVLLIIGVLSHHTAIIFYFLSLYDFLKGSMVTSTSLAVAEKPLP